MTRLVVIVGISFFVLLIRFYTFNEHSPRLSDGQHVSFQTTLLTDPKLDLRFQRVVVRYYGRDRIFITTSRFPVYSYGQTILVDGEITRANLENGGQIYTMSYPQITVLDSQHPLFRFSQWIRIHISTVFSEYLPFPSSSLLIGIVFGIKEGMPENLTDSLTQTGIIHITAASGMNITLLAGAVFLICGTLFKRQAAILVSLFFVWLYALIAGFDSSIVRASIMASIAFSASLLGRQHTGWYALFLTGFVMIFFNPSTLFDIGFQLSIASTAGILFLVPLMGKKNTAYGSEELWFLSDDFKATTAAQLATIPIMLSTFGSYGLLSIPINLLVLWTIPFLMILGGIAALLSFVTPVLAAPVLYLSLPFLVYIEYVVTFASEIMPAIHVDSFPLSLSVGYYVLLVSITWYLYKRKDVSP